ncbi:hypothetical protein [Psychrobacillus sp. OK032]|uniref:hypothetical protein n=1 Tax=Psychrobacillus sp. OK032 TaxID=1884358 RepID=UPI000B896482|nr:hypothetical protein [Psychrobacillus sp. OK032]
MNVESSARTVSMTHDGSRNFVVLGNEQVLLANEIGSYTMTLASTFLQLQQTVIEHLILNKTNKNHLPK